MKRLNFNASGKHSKGFSLVELMIAMLLGLVLIGAATGVMLSNTQSFRATKSLSQIQDGARLGFELMARDIRQAGSIPCGNNIRLNNTSSSPEWYLNWGDAKGQLIGHTSTLTGVTNQVKDTEAITVLYADNSGASLKEPNTINNEAHGLNTGDMVFVCDTNHGSIFKATIVDKIKVTANKNSSGSTPLDDFKRNAVISKLKSRAWYIGKNLDGSKSLYLAEMNGTEIQNIEVVSGVTKLEFNYHVKEEEDFKSAEKVTNENQWPKVNLIQITLTLQDDTQSNSDKLTRSFSGVVAVRNRSL